MRRIIHSRLFHFLIHILRLSNISKRILKAIPITLKFGNIFYRICSPESFLIAYEIFFRKVYHKSLDEMDIKTFIDIGCNTGFFTLLLCERYGIEQIEGILIDADRRILKECEWNLLNNRIRNCYIQWGIVGPNDEKPIDFYVSEYSISSSAKPFDEKHPLPIKSIEIVKTPVVHLDNLINERFGEKYIDVIKIDIEGSEKEMLLQDLTYLYKTHIVFIEWHKWVVDITFIKNRFEKFGFELIDILKEDTICGLAVFRNNCI